MSSTLEIPLSPQPQTLQVTLANNPYRLTITYDNHPLGGWVLDLATSAGTDILSNIPLVTGADLLGQYAYLGLGFGLWCSTDADPDAVATFDNLGTAAHLFVVTP